MGSPLRRLFVESVLVRNLSREALLELLENHWDEIPKDMMKDLILAQKDAFLAADSEEGLPTLRVRDYFVPEQIRPE